ncbi:MAG: putative rane protein [Rickettsiaceae bacterium]|nr:putative rane protein [Rickettsiaceae bacterium]
MGTFDLVYWDNSYNYIMLINLAIAILVFSSIRFVSGAVSHINTSKELFKKDNPAFGLSLAGLVVAVTIVLTGAIYGDPIYTLEDSAVSVGLYGLMGLVLMAITRVIFDKIALPKISIRDEIVKGNISAGLVDAGNVIATAIIIRTMMVWVEANTIEGMAAVLTGFVISQLLLTATTYVRTLRLKQLNDGKPLQDEIRKDNIAMAARFAGRKIGSAFAITAASNMLVFESYDIQWLLLAWAGVSIIMMGVLSILSFIANKVILAGVDIDNEIINQRNAALGVVQSVIYISLGLLLSELMS